MNNPNVYRIPSTEEHDQPLHLTNRGRRLVAVAALSGVTLIGGTASVGAAEHFGEKTTIDSLDIGVINSTIDTVELAAEELAERHGISSTEIADQVEAGRDVSVELTDASGRAVQPGEQITVSLEENRLGEYSVSADPTNLGQ